MTALNQFVDEQIKGPFRRFHHEHRFERRGKATLMIDIIDFTSPVGLVGRMVDQVVLERYMAKLIKERNNFLKTAAEALPHPG